MWAGTANATGVSIVASPDCCSFEPGPYVQGLGETAVFDNAGASAPHNVESTQTGPDGQPLFAAEGILGGQTTPVNGTQYLKAGTYPFFCTIHGPSMSGELTIDGSQGKVVPRPSVKLSFVKQKLKRVRKAGVKVKVKATAASKGVEVTATKGKVKLGSKSGLTLKAGQTKTVTLRLTKAGRKALKKVKVAKIKLKAKVPFGKTASASRRVR
jgi:plastocyanin